MSYQQLNSQERLQLYHLKQTTNLSLREIAKKMGRSHTTISRELRRNQHPERSSYLPDTAQSQAIARRQQAKLPFAKFTPNVIEEVQTRFYVDKSSKFLVARVMKTRTSAELNQASQEAFAPIPASHLKTFTFDNGKEFSAHEQLGAELGVECYASQSFPFLGTRAERTHQRSHGTVFPEREE